MNPSKRIRIAIIIWLGGLRKSGLDSRTRWK
jgi:hypothetical protein